MENEFLNHKNEILKISQRIKEYLWEKSNQIKSRKK